MGDVISAAPIPDLDINLLLADTLSPEARSEAIAEFAQEALDEALAIDGQAFGQEPDYVTTVDGRVGAALDSVRPDGTIVFTFALVGEAVGWIEAQLIVHSPVGSPRTDPHPGLYQKSHRIYADGLEIEAEAIPADVREIVLAPTVFYAGLLEPQGPRPAESRQAPDGVYHAVAEMARRRYPNVDISFQYRSVAGLTQPAIVIEI